jgi:nicotinate-nucleotide adenylyltransferase
MTVKKIGIFGGTFNPPHVGHLIVAESICDQLGLDKLYFVPSFISPHKKRGEERLALHRLQMVRLAVSLNPRFDFSDIEIKRRGTSYTYTTVEAFRLNFSGSKLFLIIGADNYAEFNTWKNPERILALASLVVMNRPSQKLSTGGKKDSKKVLFAVVPNVEISSSAVREMIHYGKSVQYLVPRVVHQYIQRHRLYR